MKRESVELIGYRTEICRNSPHYNSKQEALVTYPTSTLRSPQQPTQWRGVHPSVRGDTARLCQGIFQHAKARCFPFPFHQLPTAHVSSGMFLEFCLFIAEMISYLHHGVVRCYILEEILW